ncbi:PH domain-containing protein [Propionibacteriaceae bacterium Y2011]|uniref:PH domain-containing protein n=1 Tax=Microlunatus sp. Y2014 TaxID=3418488 RepID=UPI003D5A0252
MLIITASVFTVLLVGGSLIGWFTLPGSIQDRFTFGQVATLLVILGVMLLVMWMLALSFVGTDVNGLRFRNGVRTHRLGWQEVRRIRLRPGDPWAVVLLRRTDAAGEPVQRMMMGIQSADGERARDAVRTINDHLAARDD